MVTNTDFARALDDYAKANQAIEHARHFGRHGDGADLKAELDAKEARARILRLANERMSELLNALASK